jgi:hypothetical protein
MIEIPFTKIVTRSATLLAMLACLAQPAGAQGAAQVSFYDQFRFGRISAQLANGLLTVRTDTSWIKYGNQVTTTARVADLDLDEARLGGGVICKDRDCGANFEPGALQYLNSDPRARAMYGLTLNCKSGTKCVSISGGVGGNAGDSIGVTCETPEDCANFLRALKGKAPPQAGKSKKAAP